jgi:hypothetical protein
MYVKKITLLTLSWIVIFSNPYNSFALLKANINTENNKIDINDTLNLNISIETDEWWEISISSIKWLDENFEVVWRSQSQWSSTQVVVVNWKTETKTSVSHQLNLELKAKKKWNYEIWPANIIEWNQKIETNSIKVEIWWDKLFLNNNHLQVPNWNNMQIKTKKENEEPSDFWKDIEKQSFYDNKNLYFIIIIFIITWLWIYIIIKQKKLINNKVLSNKTDEKTDELNFEEDKNDIIYPEINDTDFVRKIDKILII